MFEFLMVMAAFLKFTNSLKTKFDDCAKTSESLQIMLMQLMVLSFKIILAFVKSASPITTSFELLSMLKFVFRLIKNLPLIIILFGLLIGKYFQIISLKKCRHCFILL
jgi:hypothetical protein